MSENIPRPGYTRTGKSLKAVRRYYAMKNRNKSPDVPPDDDEQRPPRREDRYQSVSKRKRDDDKLSKRIAAELKTQQEANEKRKIRDPAAAVTNPATRGPGSPIILKPQDGGPTFVTEPERTPPEEAQPQTPEVYSKSVKSVNTLAQILIERPQELINGLNPSALGCMLTCFILALVYLVAMIFQASIGGHKNGLLYIYGPDNSMKSLLWLGVTSILVLFTIPYWYIYKNSNRHAIVSLTFMIFSTLSIIAYFIFIFTLDRPPPTDDNLFDRATAPPSKLNATRSPLNLWLSITFFVFHIITDSFMIRQVMNVVARQMEERSTGTTHMSVYLAPN